MINLIGNYINNLSMDDFNNLAMSKNIYLAKDELEFAYGFVKNKWRDVLTNFNSFNINDYREYFSEDNFSKICILFKEYYLKYGSYLK